MAEPVKKKKEASPVPGRTTMVPGQAGYHILKEYVTSPLQEVVEKLKKLQKD